MPTDEEIKKVIGHLKTSKSMPFTREGLDWLRKIAKPCLRTIKKINKLYGNK